MCNKTLRTILMTISRSYAVRRVGVVLGLFIGAPGAFGAIYSNDFEGTVGSEWSTNQVTTAPGGTGTRFLGRFGNIPCIGGVCCPASGSTLTLTNLPPHQGLTIEFDLYIICTWDGNAPGGPEPDKFAFSVDGQPPVINTTFANTLGNTQYYPDGSLNPPGTGAAAANTLGYTAAMCGHPHYIEDATYHLSFTVAHSGSQAVFQFGGGGPNQYCNDESWGLDNVSVTTIDAIPTVSEWGMMAMAGLVLLAGGVVIARRRVA